jgi:truncated hemoglobin YjbI
MSLYEEISGKKIQVVIARFYDKAFSDGIIGHFFFHHDKNQLIERQTEFASAMLGSKDHVYQGKSLKALHKPLQIRKPHFDRRQRLLEETLRDEGVAEHHIQKWLAMEEKLRSHIVKN